ncbi:MAG: AgmX/PglI C-terminal domain-containing protein [Deltaproteobacteria bacterium]|nr:AgmX/PglI C-terminal domain-containing protein [Deltaproteobacteria bacterium]
MTKKFTHPLFIAAVGLLLVACHGPKTNKRFEKRFAAAKKANDLDHPVVISAGDGQALQTNVQKVGEPIPPAGTAMSRTVPETLSARTLARLLRHKVSRLKYCMFNSSLRGKSGKAVLTLEVAPSGYVTNVSVDAPAFRGTSLASCIRKSAELWRFPRFHHGTLHHSYPIIFRGR